MSLTDVCESENSPCQSSCTGSLGQWANHLTKQHCYSHPSIDSYGGVLGCQTVPDVVPTATRRTNL